MLWNVAAAQIHISDAIEKNLQTIQTEMDNAKKRGAHILCFPEISLISNESQARRIIAEQRIIAEKAKACELHVIFGSYVLDDEKKLRNRIIVINKQGVCVMKYSKRHLYRSESKDIVAGKRNRIFTLDGVRCAVINCWDYAFPEHIRALAVAGVDIIFCPSYLMSHPDTKEVLDKIPQVRAFDAMSYFVMVDGVTNETFKRSKICHPLRCMKEIKDKTGMILATIDTADIALLRQKYCNLKAIRQPVSPIIMEGKSA